VLKIHDECEEEEVTMALLWYLVYLRMHVSHWPYNLFLERFAFFLHIMLIASYFMDPSNLCGQPCLALNLWLQLDITFGDQQVGRQEWFLSILILVRRRLALADNNALVRSRRL